MTKSEIKKAKAAMSQHILHKAVVKLSDLKIFGHFQDISDHFNTTKNAWPLSFSVQHSLTNLNSEEYQLLLRYMGYRLMIDRNTGLLVILRAK